MKIEILTLCDFAQADATGKLTIVGAFDHLFAPQEPITRPFFSVAARIRFEADEEGQKTIALSFVDSDGNRVMPVLNAQFPIKIQQNESSCTVNFAMIVPQIKLPKFGDYQFDLAINSKIEGAVPLFVRKRDANPNPGA